MKKIILSLGFLVFIFLSTTVSSQTLVQGEYFYDTDHGVGNGTAISFTSSDSVDIVIPSIPTTGQIPGYHHLYIRTKSSTGKWGMYVGKEIFIQPATSIISNQVVSGEYFYDTDHGVGTGTAFSFSTLDSVDVTANFPTTTLSPGYHHLFIRTVNSFGQWSMYAGREIFVQPATSIVSTQVISGEYFFDTDNGIGSGIPFSFSTLDSVNITSNFPTTTLAPGYHHLFIRVKGTLGKWSMYDGRELFIQPPAPASTQIVSAEYFYDADPGIGSGIAISTGTLDSVDVTGTFPTTTLKSGYHHLFIRAKNNLGKWSMYAGREVFIQPSAAASTHVVSAEYFIDTDPGVGHGRAISPSFTAADSVTIIRNCIDSFFLGGPHNLFIRTMNNLGEWSFYARKQFYICANIPNVSFTTNNNSNNVCLGQQETFTDASTNLGGSPKFYWDYNNDGIIDDSGAIAYHTYLSVGIDTVTEYVYSATGCSSKNSVVVTVNPVPAPSITAGGATTICYGDSVSLDAGSFASYLWSNGSTLETTYASTSGTFAVTVTNNGGCTGTTSIDITERSAINPSITPYSSTTFCAGGFVILNTGSYSSYLWNTGGSTQSISATNNGNYTVTVTDINNCTASVSQFVTVNPNPTPVITPSGATTFCIGDTVVLALGNYSSYFWSDGETTESITVTTASNTYSSTVTDINGCTGMASQLVTVIPFPIPVPVITPNGLTTFCQGGNVILNTGNYSLYNWSNGATTQSISVSATGSFNLMVTDTKGCVGNTSASVTVNPNPVPVITPNGPTSFCFGGSVMLSVGNYPSYLWSNGATTQSITTSTTGNYFITVTDANGCMGITSQAVNVGSSLAPVITPSGPTTFCNGGSVSLDAGNFSTYQWSTLATMESIVVTTTGTYSVTVTDGSGCSGTVSQLVTVNSNPNPVITPTGSTTFCQGGSVSLNAGSYSSYLWSSNATIQSISASTTGNYSVTVTDINGCSGIASQSVTVNGNPSPVITPNGTTTFCQGGSVMLNAGSYSSYIWSTTATTQSISVIASGTYTVTIANASGCTGIASQSVTVNANATPVITPSGPTTFCQGGSVNLSVGVYSNYHWSNAATTQSIAVSVTGSYSVTVTNSNGCTGVTSQVVTVNTNLTPVITPGGPTNFCTGGNVSLNAGVYNTYLWSTNATTQTITVATTGTYTVTVTNANGCSGTTSQSVLVNANLTPVITPNGPTTFCQGGSVMLNPGNYSTYNWSTTATTQTITASTTGTYSVTVFNANGCSGTVSQVVIALVNPVPNITPNGPTTFCQGGSVSLSVAAFASYSWNPIATAQSITASATGTYSVTVTSNNGCTGITSKVVTVNPIPVPVITPSGPTTFCQGGNVSLNAGSYASYSWSNGATTQSITASATGTYSVTVNSNGCLGNTSQTITVNPSPVPVITPAGPTTFCQGGSVLLSVGSSSIYHWSNQVNTQTTTVSAGGTYSVTVTDGNGCSGTTSQVVTVNLNPVPVITPNGPTTFCQGGSVLLNPGNYSSYSWSSNVVTPTSQIATATTSGFYSVQVTDIHGCTGNASVIVIVNPVPSPVITGPGTACFLTTPLATGSYSTYLWSNGATTQTTFATGAGTYKVTVSYATGCTGTASDYVSIPLMVIPVITGPTSPCAGTQISLGLTAAYTSYSWSQGSTTASILVSFSGTYTVTVHTGSCVSSGHTTVTFQALPTPTITGTNLTSYCEGNLTATLTTSTAYPAYHWSTLASTQSITVAPGLPGPYAVIVTATNGCTGVASYSLSSACAVPVQLPMTGVAATSATANWTPPACVYGYTIRISKHNSNIWTSHIITPNSHFAFSGLTISTSYDWQIENDCNASGSINSGFSPTQTFTTLARLEGESSNTIDAFNVYPNPANDHATLVFTSGNEANYSIRLMDITGRNVLQYSINATIGENQFQLDLSQVAKGVYLVILQNKDAVLQSRIVVQ